MPRAKGFKERLQDNILQQRGLTRLGQGKLGVATVQPTPPIPSAPPRRKDKTPTMQLIELQTGMLIEHIIMEGSIRQVGKMLGLDKTTISKWRLHLGLRTRADHTERNSKEDNKSTTTTTFYPNNS